MAVDVSKIPNNSKFDPVREAILKLQKDVRDGVSGVATVNSSDGNITITNSGNITVGTVGETITIGINDSSYLTEELNDLTAAVTWANVPDANITESSVTQHQAALSITESQISDLGSYIELTDLSITTSATPSGGGALSYDDTTGVFTFTPADAGTGLTLQQVTANGNTTTYGISTGNISVQPAGTGSGIVAISANSVGDARVDLTPGSTAGDGVIRTTIERGISFEPFNTEKVFIASDGNMNVYEKLAVGKTTAAASYHLEVDGTALAHNFITSMTASGTTYTGTFSQYYNALQIRTVTGGTISIGGSGPLSVQNNVAIKDGNLDVNGDVTADFFIGDGSQLTNISSTVNIIANDTFNGTYPIVWRDGSQLYSSTWMTVTGATDTLNIPTINFSGRLLKDSNSASDTINIRAASSGQYFRLMSGNGGFGIADSEWTHTLEFANYGPSTGNYSRIHNNSGKTIQIGSATNQRVNLTGMLEVGTFSQSQTNNGEAWIGRAADRSAGTLTVQLGTGTGRRFEVVDYGWTTVEFSADDSGIAFAAGSFRAPIFYDSDNTGYYSDPAGTTYLNVIGAAGRIYTGYDSGVAGSVSCNQWFRSSGNTGWYNATYSGGIHMIDSTWLRAYNNKKFYVENTDYNALHTAGGLHALGDIRGNRFYDDDNTTYFVNPNGVSYMNQIDGPYFRNIQIPQSGLGSSYDERVLLLIPKVETNDSYNNRVHGKFTIGKTGGNVIDYFDVEAQSVYNNTTASFTSSGQRTGHEFVTCTYNGIKWLAIKFNYTANPYNYAWFHGHAITNFSTQAQADMLKIISYVDLSSGTTVLNSEIYNSIASYTPDPLHKTMHNGSGSSYNMHSRLNLYAPSSGWEDGLNLYSSDKTNKWNLLVDNGASDMFRVAYNSGEKFRIQTNGEVYTLGTGLAGSDYRAPIFYDSNNTTYYLDPASTGRAAYLRGHIEVINELPLLKLNDYTATNTTNLNAWVSFQRDGTEAGYVGYGSSGNNYLYVTNYDGRVYLGGSLTEAANQVRSPIYYDSDNTGYYVNPSDLSYIVNMTAERIGVNPSGSSTSRYGVSLYGGYSSGEPTYGLLFTGTSLGTHGSVTGNWATYFTMNNDTSRGWIFRRAGSGNCASISGGGVATFDGSVRSPIFYDSNNTNYYVNPEGTSYMQNVLTNDGFRCNTEKGMVGNYDSAGTADKIIWTIGDSWNSLSNHYGIGYDYNSSTYGHHLVFRNNGAAYSRIAFAGNGAYFAGTVTASGDVVAYSDERIKENIETIDNALDIVKDLRGVRYDKIDTKEKGIGVIAQEVEKILPEVVKEHQQDGMKTVAYGNIVGVLIEAIKEQQKQIDELKSLINKS